MLAINSGVRFFAKVSSLERREMESALSSKHVRRFRYKTHV